MKSKRGQLSVNLNPIFSVAKDGTVLYSNEASEPLLQEWDTGIGEKLPSSIVDIVQSVISRNSPEKIEVKVENKLYLVVFSPLPEQECVNISGFEISDQKKSEEETKVNEERLKALMDNNPSLIFMKDECGRYVYLNRAYEKKFVLSKDWYGKTDFDFWSKESAELFRANDSLVLRSGMTHQFMEDSNDLNGKRFCWLNYKFPFIDSKNNRYVGGIGIDATDHIRAEEALKKSEQRFRALVTTSSEAVYRMSPDWEEMYQLTGKGFLANTEKLNNKWLEEYILPEDQKNVTAVINKAIQTKGIFELEHRVRQADGSIGWTFSRAIPILNESDGIVEWFGSASDITERKWTEEALRESEKQQTFLLRLSDALRELNDPDEIQSVASCMLGEYIHADRVPYARVIDEQEVVITGDYVNGVPSIAGTLNASDFGKITIDAYKEGKWVIFSDISTDPRFTPAERDAYKSINVISNASLGLVKNNKWVAAFGAHSSKPRIWTEFELSLIAETAERLWAAVERARAEEALKKAHDTLDEKVKERTEELKIAYNSLKKVETIRKKEIHHRIKNNLQVISSLLDLQAEKFRGKKNIEDSQVLEAFKESQDRVISMALIHEGLHKGGEIDTLNFSQYIEELADNLFLTYKFGNDGIILNMDIEENIFFDMDTSIPLGMIINELVSNSLKHAFSGREKEEIKIKLHREENKECTESISKDCKSTNFTLIISDNGVGIPEELDIENLDSLGFQLVTSLVDQLEGEFELKRNNGTEFTMKFAVTEKDYQASTKAPKLIE